jgi:hypothetical protein
LSIVMLVYQRVCDMDFFPLEMELKNGRIMVISLM